MTDNLTTFIAALRSGEFNQAREVLVQYGRDVPGSEGNEHDDDFVGFCCLGLGSVLAGCNEEMGRFQYTLPEGDIVEYDTLPGPELFHWLGIDIETNQGDEVDWSYESGRDIFLDAGFDVLNDSGLVPSLTLASLNDWGCTFDQIADMIEHFGLRGQMVRLTVEDRVLVNA